MLVFAIWELLLIRRLIMLKRFKYRRSRAGGNPVAHVVKSLDPRLRGNDGELAVLIPLRVMRDLRRRVDQVRSSFANEPIRAMLVDNKYEASTKTVAHLDDRLVTRRRRDGSRDALVRDDDPDQCIRHSIRR